jgi:hypothetical protein
MAKDIVEIARASYEAYVAKDRAAIEALIAEDFHFTSPLDNRIDRTTYFARCWPNSPDGGGEGMLVTTGGRFGGYGLYLLEGKPVFLYNLVDMARFRWEAPQALTAGKHTIVFDFKSDGPGFGKGGTGVLKVDGTEVANQKIPHTIPIIMPWDETFDVGVDTRTGVDDEDYQVPFRFTGEIAKLTVALQA